MSANSDRDPHGLVPHRADTALAILDLISDFSFEGGAEVVRAALPVARRIAPRHGSALPLFTANDAYVRDLELLIPRDCISARTRKDTHLAIQYFKTTLGANVSPSTKLRLPNQKRR